jgi:hypothetical protein
MRWRIFAILHVVGTLGACRDVPVPARQIVAVTRPAGSWQGSGNRTIGFVSESGRFRIHWETRDETAPQHGTFRLSVNSAVSGRPIQLAVDVRGVSRGTYEFADDPRPYNFMVDSANIQWSFSVEEIVAGEKEGADSRR